MNSIVVRETGWVDWWRLSCFQCTTHNVKVCVNVTLITISYFEALGTHEKEDMLECHMLIVTLLGV